MLARSNRSRVDGPGDAGSVESDDETKRVLNSNYNHFGKIGNRWLAGISDKSSKLIKAFNLVRRPV